MENNNMNEQQTNWQQALNEFSDQPQQPVSQAQPQQYTQPVSYTHLPVTMAFSISRSNTPHTVPQPIKPALL